jgi:tetratricopeptide (TPR) repeat protein
VAVLIGADHLFPQTSRLSRLPGIRLIESSSFLPLAPAELDSAWRITDLPLLLGASLDGLLAIAAPQTRNPQRTIALLDRLVQAEPDGVFSSYYQARWQLTMGHYREAADLLEALLAKVPPDSLPLIPTDRWSWPPFRHIYHKGLFLRGALYDLQGDHENAARLYQKLLDSVPAHLLRPPRFALFDYTDVAAYLRLLIREGFRGGAKEAERSSDFRECGTTDRIPGRP